MQNGRLLVLVLLLSLNNLLYCGAWVQGKKNSYIQLSFTYLKYNKLIIGNKPLLSLNRSVSDNSLQYFAQTGITDKLDIFVIFPYKFLESGNKKLTANSILSSGSLNSFGNIEGGLQYLLSQKNWIQSIKLGVSLNTSKYQHESGLRSGFDRWSIYTSYLFGKSINKNYLSSEIGIRINSNKYADDFIFNFEYGFSKTLLSKSLWLIPALYIVLPINEGKYANNNSEYTGLYMDEMSFISPGIKINYEVIKKWWINISTFIGVYARFGGAAPTFTIGIANQIIKK